MQHVRNSPPVVVRDDLAHACTHFLGMNRQDEGSRVPWLFSLIEATGEPDFYRQKVIVALEQMPDDPDDTETFNELYGLLAEFAARGDAEALAIMRRRFETANVLYEPHFGFEELFRIEGIDALIRLLCREWKRVRDDETLCVWDDEIKHAEETLGKEIVQAVLEKESLGNESVRLYLERLARQEKSKAEQKPPSQSPLPRLTELVDGLNEDLPQETDWTDDTFRDVFWRRYALFLHSGLLYAKPTPEELEYAFQKLLEVTDPGRQFCLLATFVKETMPRLEPRLLSLFDSSITHLRWEAAKAFSRMSDPQVRAKGLELIAKAPVFNDWSLGIRLLEKNYQPEDESLLQQMLELIPQNIDPQELWHICYDTLDLIDNNAEFLFESILPWIYENMPCPHCRSRSVRLMLQRNIASKNLLEECLDDSYEDTRKLARSALP